MAMNKARWLMSLIVLAVAAPQAGQADPQAWPATRSPAALTDPATEARITTLMQRMTLRQKIGQLIQADLTAIKPADLKRYPLGSILAGGNGGPYGNERADAATWVKLVGEFRAVSRRSGAGIPILFGVDAVHGHSNLPGATIFPHNIGLGAAHDPELLQRIGAVTAAELSGSGIDWTFAPTLAVPQDLRWGRSYEGYSSQPSLIAAYARSLTLGLQGPLTAGTPLPPNKVAATAKHFVADGGTEDGKDQGDARISEAELVGVHAAGYAPAVESGVLAVMASFSSWNGTKAHGNHYLLTDVLKGRMGFAGLVVGDWNGHGQIPGCTPTDCPQTINAGLDLVMAPDSWKGLFDSTVRHARRGTIKADRIDDAVRRVLRVKAQLGLLDAAPMERGDPSRIGAPSHLEIAREAVAKSLVLLKNNDGVLPVRPGARVLIAGPGADNMAMQSGGWTVTWQGTDTSAADFPKGQTIGRAIAAAVREAGGEAVIASDGAAPGKPDVAIVVFGEQPYAEFQGDVPDLAFRALAGEAELIARLKAQGTKVVSVFLSGRPLFVPQLFNASDAFVAAWLPGSQGQGVADVLVARRDGTPARDFSGRLPFAWPADARSPVTAPVLPVGHGLNYRTAVTVGALSEDPKMDLAAVASEDSYMLRGKILAPWRLGIDSAVTARAIDISAQEDARQFRWAAPGAIAIDGPPVALTKRSEANFSLQIDWRIDTPAKGPVLLSLGGATLDISAALKALPLGEPSKLDIPLACFAKAGADLGHVGTALRLQAPAGFAMSLRTARLGQLMPVPACPPKAT
ncbi:glycoside hydrolase family 3 N-terminal domain-containing protein [Sandarakinorhabdus sp.]|uniref:glycoside hydrolase family 3 protein n=1 Tax=Sandarakinorhabdus sp. TaxID=1916663 RepID=UPI00286E486C|nr:glycoside hydrolase family 3 N-terminal domain-containing protein [Sandarakinorhabdus sp.]